MVTEEYQKHEQDETEVGICASNSRWLTHSCPKCYLSASIYEMIQPIKVNGKKLYKNSTYLITFPE